MPNMRLQLVQQSCWLHREFPLQRLPLQRLPLQRKCKPAKQAGNASLQFNC